MTEIITKAVWSGETNTWSYPELTAEELAQREADAIASAAQQAEAEAAAEALAELKASARTKLVAGQPLTEAEAATLVI